jgi:hypothetical protein
MLGRVSVVLMVAAALLLAGCVGHQSRDAHTNDIDESSLMRNRQLHGPRGDTINRIFHSDEFQEIFLDMSGEGHGMQMVQFHYVQMALNPLRPLELSIVGFVRQLQDRSDGAMLYEFYDRKWGLLALLDSTGALHHVASGDEMHMGRHQMESAAFALYDPQSGYGYDRLLQDQSGARMWDAQISAASPRERGVFHRRHRDAPPVLVVTRVRGGEAAQLAERFAPDRFEERETIRRERLRHERDGGIGRDETYGGLRFRDGNPVDSEGRPMYRGRITYND